MHETTLAKRYALALAELAADGDQLDTIGEELHRFQEILRGTPGLRLMLVNPTTSSQVQEQILTSILTVASFSKLVGNFLKLLIHKHRMDLIEHMVTAYHRELEIRRGRITVRLTTPMSLSPAMASRMQETLSHVTQKQVNLEQKLDPSLLGGAVVRIGSLMLDYSVRSKLNRLKAFMKG